MTARRRGLTGHGGLSRPLLSENYRFRAVQVRNWIAPLSENINRKITRDGGKKKKNNINYFVENNLEKRVLYFDFTRLRDNALMTHCQCTIVA